MIVECPDCGSRYRIEDAKIPSSGGRVSCPACDYGFIVWPGGETAELASADPAGVDGSESEDESTAVANAEEIRKQVEQSVPKEASKGDGGQSPGRSSVDEGEIGGQQASVGQQESAPVGARQASSQAEESSPQEGGIPDFLEEAMDGTEEEGTVEMENPFLDDDGSMSVPEDFEADAEGSPEAPGPETSNPAAPGPETAEADREDLPDLSQGDPNATNPVPLEERQPTGAQQEEQPAGESSGFDDATQEISDPSSLVDDEEEADDLFGGDLFGDEDDEPSEPSTEELDRESQPVAQDDVGGRSRQETPVSGTSAAMEDQKMELDREPAEQSSPESSPAAPSSTGEVEPPGTDELEAGDAPELADEEEATEELTAGDGMAPSEGDGRQRPGGSAPSVQAQAGGARGAQAQGGSAQARSGSQEQADEQEVSSLLVAVFVLLLAIFFVLLAGALGLFDLRAMLPGLSASAASQEAGQTRAARQVRQAEHDSIEPMVQAGEASLEANRLHDALRHFKTAKMTAPESSRVHRMLAETYRKLGKTDRASTHRLRATRLAVDGEEVTDRRTTSAQ